MKAFSDGTEHSGGHSRVTQFGNQEDTVGPAGIRKDTSLRRFGTVRLRVQIPGPRPFLYSKPAISGVVRSRRITTGSQFSGELSRPMAEVVIVVDRLELARQQSMAARSPHAKDATGRTVRHPVRKSQADVRDHAQVNTVTPRSGGMPYALRSHNVRLCDARLALTIGGRR